MNFLQSLFSKSPDPRRQCHDTLLGDLRYRPDDEAWFGTFDSIPVSVAYNGQALPDPILTEYAASFLQDRGWLNTEIEEQSNQYVSEFPTYAAEVGGLVIGLVQVYRCRDVNKALIDLEGGYDDRTWRIEFTEHLCNGIGFDS